MRKFFKNSFIYLGAEIINKAIPFLLLPIITKYLSPSEYGIYGMYQVIISFLIPFIRMSLDIHITRNYFKVSKEKLSKILSSIILILHFNVLIGIIIVFIITLLFNNPFGINNNMLLIMPIIIYAQVINNFNLTILRNKEKAFQYGIVQIVITTINLSLTLVLLIFFHKGWQSLVYSILVAHFIVMIYSFFSLKKEYNLGFKFYSFKEIYKISIPLIFHLLGGSIIFLSDRLFIQQIEGLKEVGLYSIGNQFGMITMILINSIVMAINPWMYKKLSKNINIDREMYLLMGLFIFLGIIVWIGSLFIFPYMVDKKYIRAEQVIFWISMAFVFRGFNQLYYNIIVNAGKTNILLPITFSTAVLNVILNYFLINQNGMIGAAQATTIAFLYMILIEVIYVKFRIKGE